jgi:hypothetical protein
VPRPARRRSQAARGLLLLAFYLALTWLMVFQLGRGANGRPTLGDLDEATLVASPDGPLVIWILSWSAHALRHHPARLFDANAFHPVEGALAYTESLAPLAPLWALLEAAAGDPFLALNLLLLILTVLNLCGAHALAAWLTGRTDAAMLAAVVFAFGAYASAQRVHLQLQAMFLMPVALLLLFRWLETRRRRDAALFAAVAALQAVTVVYYGVVLAVMAATVLAAHVVLARFRPGRRFAGGLATAILVGAALVAPFAAAYLDVPRSPGPARLPGHDLQPLDLLAPSVGSLVHQPLERLTVPRSEEHRHFPGLLAAALGAAGLWQAARAARAALRRAPPPGVEPPPADRGRHAALLAAAGAACLVLAFGDELAGVPLPLRFLDALPVLDRVRVPARLAVGTLLAGSALAALGYARLTGRLWRQPPRRRALALLAAAAAVAAVALENASRTRLFPLPVAPGEAAVNRALAAAPPGAVLELPIATGVGRQPARMEARRLLLSTADWKPRVNGYSGGYPPGYFRQAMLLSGFPDCPALRRLARLDVRYVVLRVDDPESRPRLSRHDAERILARLPPGARWRRHGRDVLVDLGPAAVAARAASACQEAPQPAPLAAAGGAEAGDAGTEVGAEDADGGAARDLGAEAQPAPPSR